MLPRGYRPDPPEVRARRAGLHILAAKGKLGGAALPLKTTNRFTLPALRGGPGILNQGQTGSCTGHATGAGTTLRFALQGKPIPLASPIAAYTFGRCIGRQPGPDGKLPPLTDEGAEPSQVIAGLSEWGICSAATWGSFPADPSTINAEPTLAQLEAAREYELSGAYFVQSTEDQAVIDTMTALAAAYPVCAALPASGAVFQNYRGGVLVQPLTGPVDHYPYLVDYEWNGVDVSSVVFYVSNSWDVTWGESDVPELAGGLCRIGRPVIAQLQDCAVLDVVAPAGATER